MAEDNGSFNIFLTPTSRRVPMIGTVDIGKEIARLLVNGWSGEKILGLGSPVSPDELADAMSQVLERPVQARSTPRDQWAAALTYHGIPPGATGPYEQMMDSISSGWIDFGVPGMEAVAGKITPALVFERSRKA